MSQAEIFVILSAQGQQHDVVSHQGRTDVDDGIADPIYHLGKGGMVTEEHEHGDKNRSQYGPFS